MVTVKEIEGVGQAMKKVDGRRRNKVIRQWRKEATII